MSQQHLFDEAYEHEGTSDATPGGYDNARRPGEVAFAVFLSLFSIALLWNAYGISGFEALSGPGTVPMLTAAVMLITALVSLAHTLRRPLIGSESIARDILPRQVLIFFVLLVLYGILLRPLGFLPTSALFLIASVKLLGRYGLGFSMLVSLGTLAMVWIVFRLIFSVLMPEGIVPEGEFIQMFRNLTAGGAA